jgi:hypothetical protein
LMVIRQSPTASPGCPQPPILQCPGVSVVEIGGSLQPLLPTAFPSPAPQLPCLTTSSSARRTVTVLPDSLPAVPLQCSLHTALTGLPQVWEALGPSPALKKKVSHVLEWYTSCPLPPSSSPNSLEGRELHVEGPCEALQWSPTQCLLQPIYLGATPLPATPCLLFSSDVTSLRRPIMLSPLCRSRHFLS